MVEFGVRLRVLGGLLSLGTLKEPFGVILGQNLFFAKLEPKHASLFEFCSLVQLVECLIDVSQVQGAEPVAGNSLQVLERHASRDLLGMGELWL